MLDKFNQVCQIMFENKVYPIQVLWHLQTVNRFIAIDYISYSGNTKTYGNQSFTLRNDLQRGDFIKLKGNEVYENLLDELSKYKKQFN